MSCPNDSRPGNEFVPYGLFQLKQIFSADGFKVLTAKNGNQAFKMAAVVIPDLIISDI